MDIFVEKIVAKKKDTMDRLFVFGSILLGIVVVFALPFIPLVNNFTMLFVVAVAFGAYWLITSRNIEYEYIVTNGELDVDMIVSRRKRKRIFSAHSRDFNVVAKVNSPQYEQEGKGVGKRINAVSSVDSPEVYFTTLNYKGEKTILFFEPDKRMLDAFKTYIPRKVFE